MMRTCKKCKIQKELNEFSTSPECKLGYRYECKACRNLRYVKKGKCTNNLGWFKKGHKSFEWRMVYSTEKRSVL